MASVRFSKLFYETELKDERISAEDISQSSMFRKCFFLYLESQFKVQKVSKVLAYIFSIVFNSKNNVELIRLPEDFYKTFFLSEFVLEKLLIQQSTRYVAQQLSRNNIKDVNKWQDILSVLSIDYVKIIQVFEERMSGLV
ncbi:MAG: hypothetical protein MHPSP_001347 [Paramarteilia canceri]